MTTHELLKILDNTFPDVEFNIFTDIEGLVRVNFVVDDEQEDEWQTKIYIGGEFKDYGTSTIALQTMKFIKPCGKEN